jgi:hypothetical protein
VLISIIEVLVNILKDVKCWVSIIKIGFVIMGIMGGVGTKKKLVWIRKYWNYNLFINRKFKYVKLKIKMCREEKILLKLILKNWLKFVKVTFDFDNYLLLMESLLIVLWWM